MKFTIKNPRISVNHLIRKIGYCFLAETPEHDLSLVRPINRNHYPRFHIYLKINPVRNGTSNGASKKTNKLSFNLHLDQKKPSYKGAAAHSGEYKGKIIEQEVERIKQIL